MNYFDYLRTTKREDTKQNFINYLIDVLGFTEAEAKKESIIYYN